MKRIQKKELEGKDCFSIIISDIEYYFEYNALFENMPRFLQIESGNTEIRINYEVSEMVNGSISNVIFENGLLAEIIVSTNRNTNKRGFKAKTIEILKVIENAIGKAVNYNCFSQDFVKSTDSEIETIATTITRHKNRISKKVKITE